MKHHRIIVYVGLGLLAWQLLTDPTFSKTRAAIKDNSGNWIWQ